MVLAAARHTISPTSRRKDGEHTASSGLSHDDAPAEPSQRAVDGAGHRRPARRARCRPAAARVSTTHTDRSVAATTAWHKPASRGRPPGDAAGGGGAHARQRIPMRPPPTTSRRRALRRLAQEAKIEAATAGSARRCRRRATSELEMPDGRVDGGAEEATPSGLDGHTVAPEDFCFRVAAVHPAGWRRAVGGRSPQ